MWTDGNPGIYSEWATVPSEDKGLYKTAKGDALFDDFKFISHETHQPTTDRETECTAMVMRHKLFHISSLWFKLPCEYPIASNNYICKWNNVSRYEIDDKYPCLNDLQMLRVVMPTFLAKL